jgi:O-antigen/teichoic acid export membrane protein
VRTKDFTKEIGTVFLSNVIGIFTGFAVGIIISRILGPEGKGVYSSILVIPIIFINISLLGTRQSTIFLIGKKTFSLDEITSNLTMIFIISSILGVLICAFYYLFVAANQFTLFSTLIILLTIPFVLVINYSGSIFLGLGNFTMANTLKWLTSFINLVFVFFLLWVWNFGIMGALLSLLFSNFLIALFAVIVIGKRYKIRLKVNKVIIKEILYRGFGFTLALVIIQLNYRIDIIILQYISGMQEVGYYSIGVSIAENLWLLPTAVGIVINSITANSTDLSGLTNEISKLIRITFMVVFLFSIAIFIFIPYVLPWFYGEQFNNSVMIVKVILPGVLIFVLVRILSSYFAGIGKPSIITYIFAPALLLNIALNFILIPKYGGIGAAIATNISYSLGALALLVVYCKYSGITVVKMFTYRKTDFEFAYQFRRWILKLK